MTICLPSAIARRACAMPAGAWPVASTTTSMSADRSIAGASSVKRVAAMRSSLQPTRRHASRARSGARSAIAATSIPGVDGTCARNIEPNLPAPISPTRTGRPCSRRLASSRCRFIRDVPFRGSGFVAHCYARTGRLAMAGPSEVEWRKLRADQLREMARADAIVILPVASLEQHGPHLPVEVDSHAGRNGRCPRRAQGRRTRRPGGGAAGAVDRTVGASHELRRNDHAGLSGVQRGGGGRLPLGAAPRVQADRAAERAWRERERVAHHHRRADAEARRADRAVHLLVRRGGGDRQRFWRHKPH